MSLSSKTLPPQDFFFLFEMKFLSQIEKQNQTSKMEKIKQKKSKL